MSNTFFRYFLFSSVIYFVSCASSVEKQCEKQCDELKEYTLQFESALSSLMKTWYPRSIDTIHGGFHSDFSYHWQKQGPNNKMLVAQARHIWTLSLMADMADSVSCKRYADSGIAVLNQKLADSVYGGFFMIKDSSGNFLENYYADEKRAYSMSFAIYALSQYYKAFAVPSAKQMALESFLWLDKHSRDSLYGGYFDMITRAGEWQFTAGFHTKSGDFYRAQYKDYNSSIHLLEAFSALYDISGDSLVKQRLHEIFFIVRDVFVNDKGYLHLYTDREWNVVHIADSVRESDEKMFELDHVSFGHDIETAYLLLEASKSLKIENDTVTLRLAKALVDHSLAGWDSVNGGFYYTGLYKSETGLLEIKETYKSWWVQAEALNSLLLMYKLFPSEKKYLDLFKKQWQYISTYLVDYENGGWYMSGLDMNPDFAHLAKASDWKINYHNMRALVNCYTMLQGKSELVCHFMNIAHY